MGRVPRLPLTGRQRTTETSLSLPGGGTRIEGFEVSESKLAPFPLFRGIPTSAHQESTHP